MIDRREDVHKPAAEGIAATYAARDRAMPHDDWRLNIYHPRHPLGALFQEHNRAALVRMLNATDLRLNGSKILDVGCGFGHWLRYLVELGSDPGDLWGTDLSRERIEAAERSNPAIHWSLASGSTLPFDNGAFDVVIQVVVFSSIPQQELRRALAAEMIRVTKDDGLILWLDHRRPIGSLTGFTRETVRGLFEGFNVVYRDKVHPRYFRRVYRYSATAAKLLYAMTRLNCDSDLLILKRS